MNYAIAIGVWFIVGAIISIALNSIGYRLSLKGIPGVSLSFIVFSFLRMLAVVFCIRYLTGIAVPDTLYLTVCMVDIGWCLLMTFSNMMHRGSDSPITKMKVGQTIGSILFLAYYFFRLAA